MIKDFVGNTYDNMEEYYNTENLDDDIIYNLLARGLREPQNEKERHWLEESKEILSQEFYDMYFE